MGDDWRPVPDPTVLTTEALRREIGTLREFLEQLIEAHTRIDQIQFDRLSDRLDTAERLRLEQKADTAASIAAALQAQKEAVGKAEVANEKRFDAILKGIDELTKRLSDMLPRAEYSVQHASVVRDNDALADRLNVLEGSRSGAAQQRNETRLTTGQWIAVAAVVVALIVGGLTAILATR